MVKMIAKMLSRLAELEESGLGKRTRVKVIDCGNLLNATVKNVPHGLTPGQVSRIVRWTILVRAADGTIYNLPSHPVSNSTSGIIAAYVNATNIQISTDNDRRTATAKAYIEYEID